MAVPNSFTKPNAGMDAVRIGGHGDFAEHECGSGCNENHALILKHAVPPRLVNDERIKWILGNKIVATAAMGGCIGGMLGVEFSPFLLSVEIAGPLVSAAFGALAGGSLAVFLGSGAPQQRGERRASQRQTGSSIVPIVNPAEEDRYWRVAYRHEPYFQQGYAYEEYAQAYKLGYLRRACMTGSFAAAEPALEAEWNDVRGNSRLTWREARPAIHAAWNHATREPKIELGRRARQPVAVRSIQVP